MSERVVLVVDDEQAQRTVLAGFLRKRGFEVVHGASVEEGLAAVSARTVDLVLTDLRMPGGGGLALLEGVHAINPEIPFVVMTAFGTVASAVDAMKKGAADYLTKPIDLDELEVLIARTLERRALVRGEPGAAPPARDAVPARRPRDRQPQDGGGHQHRRPRRREPRDHPDPGGERHGHGVEQSGSSSGS